MVNNVQVSATRSRGTAAGIYDATEGPHRLAFGLEECAPAGLPARRRGRNPSAEGSTKVEFDSDVALKINVLARLTEGGPGWQRTGVYADMVRAGKRWNKCYK